MNIKKIIALTLLWMLCFGFVACDEGGPSGNSTDKYSKEEKAILGEWTSFDFNMTITFRKGGKGSDGYDTFRWKYDEDLMCYTIVIQTENDLRTFNTGIFQTEHPSIAYLIINGVRFYRFADDDLKDYKVFTAVSKGMSPLIEDGDVVLCKPVKDCKKLSVGDIIVYWTVLDGQRVSYASRIQNIYDGGGYLLFETQDDNNNYANALTVHQSEILGEFVQALIP